MGRYLFLQFKKYFFYFCFLFSSIYHPLNVAAQAANEIAIVSESEFKQMDAMQKRDCMQKWNNLSFFIALPPETEQKAMQFYTDQKLDIRIYEKNKLLLKTVCNETLPLWNRINACNFIIENYNNSEFPVKVVQEILDHLIATTK